MKLFKRNYIILIILIALVSGVVTATAATKLFDSDEVAYDNSESGIQSDDVQGAIDELYAAATTYSELDQRLSALETHSETEYNDYLTSHNFSLRAVREGKNVVLYVHSGDGGVSADLATNNAYITVATVDDIYRPKYTIINYTILNPCFYGQFNIRSDGRVEVGHTYKMISDSTSGPTRYKFDVAYSSMCKGLYAYLSYGAKS